MNSDFIKKKKLLMQISSGELNKSILYYINEARSSPKDFSRHLMVNDDVDEQISKLSLFFKYSSIPVPPLELNPNLETTSNDLLYHIIASDDGNSELEFSQKEKERNSLKERLKKLNLVPVYHVDLLVIGVDDAIDALANILINSNHRKKILSSEMKYIGISSGFLPSERLCVVIDIVSNFRNYTSGYLRTKDINYINSINDTRPSKYNYIRFTNVGSDDEYEDDNNDYVYNDNSGEEYIKNTKNTNTNRSYFNTKSKFNSDKKKIQNIKYFNSVGGYRPFVEMQKKLNFDDNKENNKDNKKEKIINLKISGQKWFSPTNRKIVKNEYYDEGPKRFKFPLSISIEKKYKKNKYGEIFPIYHRKTLYDDGSILLQPYINE